MSQARVVDVDYYILVEKLKQAARRSCLVERTDKERWKQYVADHSIRVTSLQAFGKVKFINGKTRLAGIVMADEWDGCYAYSIEDEAALQFVPSE